jgi:hypothetical protein
MTGVDAHHLTTAQACKGKAYSLCRAERIARLGLRERVRDGDEYHNCNSETEPVHGVLSS